MIHMTFVSSNCFGQYCAILWFVIYIVHCWACNCNCSPIFGTRSAQSGFDPANKLKYNLYIRFLIYDVTQIWKNFQVVFLKTYFVDPAKRQNFGKASAEISIPVLGVRVTHKCVILWFWIWWFLKQDSVSALPRENHLTLL